MEINEIIKKINTVGFNRQDYTWQDISRVFHEAEYNKDAVSIAKKIAEALTSQDIEALYNSLSDPSELFLNIFSKYTLLPSETKSTLLSKCNKLLRFVKHDNFEDYSLTVLDAIKQQKVNLDAPTNFDDILSRIPANKENVDYIIKNFGNGSPTIFLKEGTPFTTIKASNWKDYLSSEQRKMTDAIQNLSLYSDKSEIEEFFSTTSKLLDKDKKTYNFIVNYVRDHITRNFRVAFGEFSSSTQDIQTDSLEKLIGKYNQFMQAFNNGLAPYQEKYMNNTSNDV